MQGDAITFQATFSKATTLVDGGWRVSFDLSESSGHKAAQIAALTGSILQIAVVPDETEIDPLDGLSDG